MKNPLLQISNYRKPTFWIILLAIISCIVAGVCFLTNPNETATPEDNYVDVNLRDTTQFVEEWVKAFCDRNGEYIVRHTSDYVQTKLVNQGLMALEDGYYVFGWSSPWPMMANQNYRIESLDADKAEILYYAWSSDPHVTVWRETIEYTRENGAFIVTNEEILFLDNISLVRDFSLAYPDGVISNGVDYQANGFGESLNQHALSSESEIYTDLFEPDRAAVILLNLLPDTNKVKVTAATNEANSVSQVVIFFEDSSVGVEITMIKPFGENGIWIPKTRSNNDDAEEYFS